MVLDATFPPDPRVENEALSLVENGYEVFLFCFSHNKNFMKYETFKGIKICRYKCGKMLYKLSALAYTLPFYGMYWRKKMKDFILKNEIEILHIHDIQIAESCFKALEKIKKTIPTFLDLHENRPEIMKAYPHLQTKIGKLFIKPKNWKKAEEQYSLKADYIVVVTPESKEEIAMRIPEKKEKILVIPNTVRANFSKKNSIASKNHHLIYVGDTGFRRGLETAIAALPFFKKIPDIKLVILGKSSYDNILKTLVKKNNIEKQVIFKGWQPAENLANYIQNSWLGICPLHRNIHHDTTYANKIFQYMHCGKAILVSDATAQKNLVLEHTIGLVHKEKNAKDFAEKVLFLYENPETLKKFETNAEKLAKEKFCWEKTVKPLLKIYEALHIV